MNAEETFPDLAQHELLSLVSDDSLFIFPVKDARSQYMQNHLAAIQYFEKINLLYRCGTFIPN